MRKYILCATLNLVFVLLACAILNFFGLIYGISLVAVVITVVLLTIFDLYQVSKMQKNVVITESEHTS